MEQISQEQLEEAVKLIPEKKEKEPEVISEEKFKGLLEEMKNPVQAQKHLAVQIKIFLDKRIDDEMADKGYLSDITRRWVESYNNILEKIQKALHGDKSVNLHLHKVSHSQIAAKIRNAQKDDNNTDT